MKDFDHHNQPEALDDKKGLGAQYEAARANLNKKRDQKSLGRKCRTRQYQHQGGRMIKDAYKPSKLTVADHFLAVFMEAAVFDPQEPHQQVGER